MRGVAINNMVGRVGYKTRLAHELECKQCRKSFSSNTPTQQYCAPACYRAARKAQTGNMLILEATVEELRRMLDSVHTAAITMQSGEDVRVAVLAILGGWRAKTSCK